LENFLNTPCKSEEELAKSYAPFTASDKNALQYYREKEAVEV